MEVAKPLHLAKLRRARAAWVFDLRPEMFILATIVVISLTSLLYLTQASNVAATGYDITYALDERVKLERELQRLNVELARLQALDQVENEATNKLHMVPAPVPEYLTSRALPADVEAALAQAEREAEHRPVGLRAQIAALLRLGPGATPGAGVTGNAPSASRAAGSAPAAASAGSTPAAATPASSGTPKPS